MSEETFQNSVREKSSPEDELSSPASTSAQASVAQVWAEVLQVTARSVTDNFFDLGGDSLKALEVISRIHASLNVEIPLIAFFENPTIAYIAEIIDSQSESKKSESINTIQATICQIWAEVLQVPNVAITDNFFDLGGDSLKALEVIARIHSSLNVEIPLIAFFEDPTVAHAAEFVKSLEQSEPAPASHALAPEGPAPLSFSQLTFWLLQQSDPAGYLYNEPRVLRIRGSLREDVLQRALHEMCRRHQILRSHFEPGAEEPLQVVHPERSIELPVEDLGPTPSAEETAMAIARNESQLPFDLSTEPPIRARLLKLGPEDHVMTIVMHHVLSDGYTCAIFFDELGALYNAFLSEATPELPEPVPQYRDFATWERAQLQAQRLEEELHYWRSHLEGAPAKLALPTDKPHAGTASYRGESRRVYIPTTTVEQLKSVARTNGSTLFTVMLAGLRIFLHRWTEARDLVIGTVSSNRSWPGTERMLGCFLNFLPLRGAISPDESALEVLSRERKVVLDGFAHQSCPFVKIAAAVGSSRDAESNPIYNVAFLLQNFPEMKFGGKSFSAEFQELPAETALLDLRFVAEETAAGLKLDCEFKTDLFNESTIVRLLQGYVAVLETIAQEPSRAVAQFDLPAELSAQAEAARLRDRKQSFAIAASFTAEPVEPALAFWAKQLGIQAEFGFAPYNQIFQQLLDPTSLVSQNRDGFNILLLRLTDWLRFAEDTRDKIRREQIERGARDLISMLKAQQSSVPVLVCFCPPEKKYSTDPQWRTFLEATESNIAAELAGVPSVHVITSLQILQHYSVESYEDEYADKLGHIPYTPEFFAAIASMLARRILDLRSAPKKVIVLDCDNTLWKGVCGEDGPAGVHVDTPRRDLQEFMLSQVRAGMLLCLCSKNAEEDVAAVFAQNPAMVLQPEHIVAQRVNWNSKSQNLRELAATLQLGLDSFVFVDDNPIECAEVEEQTPEVLTLLLPQNDEEIFQFLRNVWAFDHWKTTAEDVQRTTMYRQSAEREQLRRQASRLDEFLAGLELKIEIRPMAETDLPRVSQLTERTNQFNFTTIRRNEAEISAFQKRGKILIVNLADRFGDYGLVGVVLFEVVNSALQIDTLLLSCRALGRKVEHHMLAHLGELARARDLAHVVARLLPTKKNRPARDFLDSIGHQFRRADADAFRYEFPTEYAANVYRLQIDQVSTDAAPETSIRTTGISAQIANQNRAVARIAGELRDLNHILRAMDADRVSRSQRVPFVPPRTPLEEMLAGVWTHLLKLDTVGVHDNFFSLGGHSLAATQVIARVRQTLGIELPLRTLFEAQTLAEFAQRIERTQRSNDKASAPPPIKQSKSDSPALGFAQQRLWFLDQLDPGSPIYNVPQMFRMRGHLDAVSLERALTRIVERHDSLRTTFHARDGEPFPVVAPKLRIGIPASDLSALAPKIREAEAQNLAKQESRRPFNLVTGPLLRAQLLRLDPEEHLLLLTMHHIVSDRWSMGVFSEELAAHYAAQIQGKPSPLPDLPIQYSDFAAWQRDWFQGEALDRQLTYWKKQLSGAPELMELPTDHPRPAIPSHEGAITECLLPKPLVTELTRLSQKQGTTLFMTLLAAFNVLLSRYSGQEDVVVGSPIANRRYAEVEPLIGFFVNTLVLRNDLSGDPVFGELLTRVKETSLQAYAHQDIPFEKLVEEVRPERSLSHSPLFQVMFALQNAPMQALALPGLKLERAPVHHGTSMFDMSWFAIEVPEGLMLRAEYRTDLFHPETIQRALGHFRKLLESVAANPGKRVSQLDMIGEDERRKLLVEFNANETELVAEKGIHDLVESSAERFPESEAAICGNERITYRDLNERANQIAHHLIQLGAAPEVLVGVFLERTANLLPAILGVLKSGAAYVPLDPSYPPERLAAIIEDSKAPIVLTQQSLAPRLSRTKANLIALDSDRDTIARQPRTNAKVTVKPENLAYVLFTSGSTGRPKGVALEHRSAVTFIQWAQKVFTPAELAGVLLSTSVCFDLSIFEMFVPLTMGGKVIVVENALYLATADARDEVTLINTVPSAMTELVRMKAVPDSIKTVNLAGEALAQRLVDEIYSSTSIEKLYNLYGPTEDTTYSTYTLTRAGHPVTIGRPLPGTQAYVLDPHGNPQPIGIPGELYLAGAGLARGYYGRPDLTAERFLPNPFGGKSSPRMYKSGDLCRWLPNAELEYLGRLDHQVKLRGFRIELGEIETALGKHSAVRQCLVIAGEDQPGLKRLVAYVVSQETVPTEESLRKHLKQSLPEFMVPSAFVFLESFPLTPNGKINRKALPAPEFTASSKEYVAPCTPVEEMVAGIWAEVLRIPQVGINDEFFSLGGHSLLATQVISRIRQACSVELPLRALFEAPTVAGLAALIEQHKKVDGSSHAPPITTVSREQEVPLSFAQQRLWFLNQLEPDNPFYNIPQGLRMRGQLEVGALEKSLNEIVRRHEVLRTTYRIQDGRLLQLIAHSQEITLRHITLEGLLLDQHQSAAQKFIAEEARNSFDLETGPLMRASVLRLSADEHILVLNTHHIASDGWSMGIFVREFTELYSAFVQGRPSPLRELPVQYADFAVWQRQWISGENLDQHLTYWRKQLENAPTAIELPADHPRPAVQSFRGETRTVVLSGELASALKDLCRREGVTLYMALLAAFQTLLYRYTGQEDVVVGSPIANRNYAEIENLIGFFVNALTMRTKLNGDPTFRELLGRVREVALGAYAHQDLPFERLVEEFDPERSLGYNPLFQVLFVLQNAPKYKLDLPGLQLEWLNIYNGTAKFDLALHVAEKPEGLSCMMEFNTDLFDASTIARMLSHFETLLRAATSDPGLRISSMPLLTPAEKQKLLVEFNHSEIAPAPENCIHQLVESQAVRTPNNIAVVFEDQSLTYRELNARANQLAHYLRKQGVGPEVLVALCMDRSLEMIVGILGILKAGGAYLPLDLAYPAERLAFMLSDANPPIVLTQEKLTEKLPEHESRTICLDRDWDTIACESPDNIESGAGPENLAYVIYTSGSTGKPKGCLVTHFNVVRLFQSTWDWYKFDDRDVWTMFHSYAFDFSVWEIWGALVYGGRVVVVPYLVSRSPEDFYHLLHKERVTVLNQTPSSFKQLIQAEESLGVHDLALRYVIFGGEALDMQSLKPWYARHGDTQPLLINMYGITETTVHVTYRPLSVNDTSGRSVIGRPIPDLQLYILDQHLQPVPIGIAGEMYVGGAGVARGYLNRPELTNERFIPDPFSSNPNVRLYKTGDLARFLPNGDVEYLGRIDHQVKIRGFRIELGEIESVLAGHPAVRHNVVMAREDEPGNKQLVAYIVPDKNAPIADEEAAGSEAQQVSQWETTFDETYNRTAAETDPAFNITGWDSSYTGQPIPAEHMREWVDRTVERIRALAPNRVLEIGCGTGLLLLRIAPDCEKYLATDFSREAIYRLEHISRQRGLTQVSLSQRMGDDFSGISHGEFDTVIINSVAQYFPSIDYLIKVLDGAAECLAPGGRIFIGDNRSLPLLEAFHTSVQLYQAPDSLSREQVAQRIQKRVSQDEELIIDPGFFHALKQRIPRIRHAEIQVKRGYYRNEMSEFRFDAVLHLEGSRASSGEYTWVDWQKENLSLASLRERLSQSRAETLAVTGVPNARVSAAIDALELLHQRNSPATVGELRAAIETVTARHAVEPEDLWSLGNELGYDVKISWATSVADGRLNVAFRQPTSSATAAEWTMPSAPIEPKAFRSPESYANNPMMVAIGRKLVPQLRRVAGAKLPDYMVPSAFVVLGHLPLTENGKVDRRALPAPDQSRRDVEKGYVAPRTPAEEMVASVWADVLRLERVGAQDEFFELGGHSLNATQVVSRVRDAFRVELPLRALFETPTVEGIAKTIESLKRNQQAIQPPAIVSAPRNRELPLSYAQQRLWFLDQMDPGNWLYNVPRAIRLKGKLDLAAMEQALNGLIVRHEILRTTYATVNDHPVQRIAAQITIDLPLIDLSSFPASRREERAQRIVQEEYAKGFNLASDPILRALAIKLSDEDHVLFLNTHHIASDGWSSGVMMNDLSAFYRAALENKPATLPQLEIQYADYAIWQRKWLQGDVLADQLTFWKRELEGAPAVLSLPTDHPRPETQSFRGAVYESVLPKNLVDGLRILGRQQGSTMFMTMLAGFESLLYYYTSQPDLVIGTDLANRMTVQTEALIGFFVNLLVLRTDVSGNPAFEELIKRVREVSLNAYAHQDLPFDKLVEELRPERNLGHSPLVQVLFVQQNTPRASSKMPGLEVERFRLEVASKFDMAVFVGESENVVIGQWVYNPDLFEPSRIARMANNFETVLRTAVVDPKIRLAAICDLLADLEKQQRGGEQKKLQEAGLEKLKKIRRKAIAEV